MSRSLHRFLNSILPHGLRTRLKEGAKAFIPSLRHLDMPERLRHIAGLGFQPRVIYDIGAARGEWARMVHAIWPHARIVGFEPNQRNRSDLEATKRAIPGFDYHLCFLGPERKTVEYHDNNTQTSLYDPSASGATATAEMLVLDQLIASGDIPPPDFMKLDVQGFELEVLAGATKALAHAEAALLEVSVYHLVPAMPVVPDVLAFMRSHGFEWYDILGLLRRQTDDALLQMDFLFVKPTSKLWRDSWT
jgi:FkbM family methyltransferase